MLERLSIRNVGGIGRCELDFGAGLTVITGESGAGKSSVVRALELAAGKRGQSSIMRAGEEEASAEAVFSTDARLPDLEDEQQPAEGAFFVKRALSRGGGSSARGRAVIQGTQVPVALYSSSVGRMMHIQSQFAQMELLDSGRQLAMVDSCGGDALRDTLRKLKEVFELARLKERAIKDVTDRRSGIERRYANASEVIPLVKKVNITEGLEASLEAELAGLAKRIADGARIVQGLDRLTGGMSQRGLLDELANVCKMLADCLPEASAECAPLLQEGLQNLNDFADIVRQHAGPSPEALSLESENLERRLGSMRKLRRLSGAKNEEELLSYCRDAERELAWLEESYDIMEKASLEARELRRQASQLAMSIRESRKSAADALELRVNALLADLAMDGTGFSINFTELPKLRRDGADGAEFTLCANVGSPTERRGKVEKIASGGELSRLLLALQLSLPDEWLPPTLVFDEVEAGLGGRAAVLSGLKLKELSRRCQVILVTHEASIAALGDRHYVIQKMGGESSAACVDGDERVREIARMLSGDQDLPEAQEHARRLLQAALI